jgi:hypothetical protein
MTAIGKPYDPNDISEREKGFEPDETYRETSNNSRTCTDHAALRLVSIPVDPGSSSLISVRVAATWQQVVSCVHQLTLG